MHQTNNKKYPKVRMALPWRRQKAKAHSVGCGKGCQVCSLHMFSLGGVCMLYSQGVSS